MNLYKGQKIQHYYYSNDKGTILEVGESITVEWIGQDGGYIGKYRSSFITTNYFDIKSLQFEKDMLILLNTGGEGK